MLKKHFDLSIVIHLENGSFKMLQSFLNKHLKDFNHNGIEILIVFSNLKLEAEIQVYLREHLFYNWKLIHVPDTTAISIYQIAKYHAVFNRLLIMDLSLVLRAEAITEIFKLVEYYNAKTVVAYPVSEDKDLLSNPYTYIPSVLFVDKNLIVENFDFKDNKSLVLNMQHRGISVYVLKSCLEVNLFVENNYDNNTVEERIVHYGTVKFNYIEKFFLQSQLYSFLQEFENYELKSKSFIVKAKVIALVSVYNERRHLKDFLTNIANNCDGIIILDDGSTDDSYEVIEDEKVLLKVRKSRNGFKDLDNRNLLLKLAFFFDADWLLFIDADERISPKHQTINELVENSSNTTYSLNFVDLWDNDQYFRADINYLNRQNQEGLYKRYRLFKNIGYCQIHLGNQRQLHFASVPYFNDCADSAVLIYHFGLLNFEDRCRKYNFYRSNDLWHSKEYYNYLLDKNVILKNINLISELNWR